MSNLTLLRCLCGEFFVSYSATLGLNQRDYALSLAGGNLMCAVWCVVRFPSGSAFKIIVGNLHVSTGLTLSSAVAWPVTICDDLFHQEP